MDNNYITRIFLNGGHTLNITFISKKEATDFFKKTVELLHNAFKENQHFMVSDKDYMFRTDCVVGLDVVAEDTSHKEYIKVLKKFTKQIDRGDEWKEEGFET